MSIQFHSFDVDPTKRQTVKTFKMNNFEEWNLLLIF